MQIVFDPRDLTTGESNSSLEELRIPAGSVYIFAKNGAVTNVPDSIGEQLLAKNPEKFRKPTVAELETWAAGQQALKDRIAATQAARSGKTPDQVAAAVAAPAEPGS